MSSVLAGGPPLRSDVRASAPQPVLSPQGPSGPPSSIGGAGGQRGNTLTVIAGVGVLLLAMGVGVLIGRSGASKSTPAPAPTITVASTPAPAASAPAAEATFTGDWPSGSSGYTVQLQTLPQSGTAVSAVEAAKSSASAKGATAVGALKSEEFSSLAAGNYVIYSGVYHGKAQAEKALAGLKKSFPAASVIHVSNGGSGAGASSPPAASPGGVGQSENHPAPPTVLKGLHGTKGKSYEEKSKSLPNVVETG
jgi:hypothetical protein